MKVLVLVICALAVCDAMPVEKVQPGSTLVTANWELYKKNFGKSYLGGEDEERKQIYLEAVKMINEHNARYEKGEVTWSMGINQFTDLRSDEVPRGLLLPS